MIGRAVALYGATVRSEEFLRWRAEGAGFPGLSPFSWALLALVLGLVAWAYLIRKRGRERSRRYRRYGHRSHRPRRLFGARRHRRHRTERPRNPTLAETGGLPPPRPDRSGSPEI